MKEERPGKAMNDAALLRLAGLSLLLAGNAIRKADQRSAEPSGERCRRRSDSP